MGEAGPLAVPILPPVASKGQHPNVPHGQPCTGNQLVFLGPIFQSWQDLGQGTRCRLPRVTAQ